jgi:hypothetical protein
VLEHYRTSSIKHLALTHLKHWLIHGQSHLILRLIFTHIHCTLNIGASETPGSWSFI